MRPCRLCLLVILSASFHGLSVSAGESKPLALGFWDIPATEFVAEMPQALRSPIEDPGTPGYIWWAFTFKYAPSSELLLQHYREEVARIQDRDQKAFITNRIELIAQSAAGEEPRVRLHASIHASSGKNSYNLSLPMIRNIAERKMGMRLETIEEIRARDLKPGEIVHGVAIFPEPDPAADAFEIRVFGLGRRFQPNYDPGQLYFPDQQYNAHIRKSMRFFYTRPGDETARERDPIYFVRRTQEWIWMWYMDFYPTAPVRFVEVERSSGLRFTFAYFPYTVLNSTRTPQPFEVLEAGVSPRLAWQGLSLSLDITDDNEADFWKIQAMRRIRADEPDLLPAEGEPYHARGDVPPGTEEGLKGVAVMRWGVPHPAQLMRDFIRQLHVLGLTGSGSADHELIKGYLALRGADAPDARIWERAPLPDNARVEALILEQASRDLAALGVVLEDVDRRQYGDLAPLVALVNHLARRELDRLQDEKNSILPLRIVARWGGIDDEVRVMRRYNVDLTSRARAILDVKAVDVFTPTVPVGTPEGGGTTPPVVVEDLW